jgi:DNA-binding transcriptional LysR family regulator
LRLRITGPLREVGHALNEVRALPSDVAGPAAIGMSPATMALLGEPLARRVAAEAPHVALQLVEGASARLLQWLQEGQLDSAIVCSAVTPVGVNATKLLEEQVMLVGPADAGLRPDTPVPFSRLADLPLLLPSAAHGLRGVLEDAALAARRELRVRMEVDSTSVAKELVAGGLGYAALPAAGVGRELSRGVLTCAPIAAPAVTRQLFVAMRSTARSPRAVLQLEEFVRQETAALAADGRWPVLRLMQIGDI